MKNDLTCEVVQDLLPLYVDDLVHEQTREAVDRHLKCCPDCTARKNAMEAPEASAGPEGTERRELDYLRSVRRKTRRRVWMAAAGTAAVLLVVLAVKTFWIGKAADLGGMFWNVTETETGLHIQVDSEWSGVAYVGWRQRQEGENSWSLNARQVLPLPGISGSRYEVELPLTETGTVTLCGETIWQNGIMVQPKTLHIWETKTPYMGAPSALLEVAEALQISQDCGPFTSVLQSAEEPYGWTLEFAGSFTQSEVEKLSEEMNRKACQAMALVGNLGEVSWTCRMENGQKQTFTLSQWEAEESLGSLTDSYNQKYQTDYSQYSSLKTYGDDAVKFQILCDILS